MDNTLGRTISETRENLVAGYTLSNNNILALIDAYVYGTVTPMIALIKTLRMMYVCKSLVKCLLIEVEGTLNKDNTGGTYKE